MNKRITLIVFEGNKQKHTETEKVYNYLKSLYDWEYSHYLKLDLTYEQAMAFELGGYLQYMADTTTHALICTWDGFIINPEKWDDSWLEYDMIGAPWPVHFASELQYTHRVGNTGFTLQSRKFLELAKEHKNQYTGGPGDKFLCITMHDLFVQKGIKYAPIEIAAKFSWECDIEDDINGSDKTSFGFHGFKLPQHHYYNKRIKEDYYSRFRL